MAHAAIELARAHKPRPRESAQHFEPAVWAETSANAGSVNRCFDELQITRLSGCATRVLAGVGEFRPAAWPYLLVYSVAGTCRIERPGCAETVAERHLAVYANESEFRVEGDRESVTLLIRVPAGAVGPYNSEMSDASGLIGDTSRGTLRLAARLLDGLAADLNGLAPLHPGKLARHVIGFVALACEDLCASVTSADRSGDPNLARAKSYIEAHLADLELNPHDIAGALNISVRTLHRAFERESMSVAGWIRWRRLEHCRSELADRTKDNQAVSAIGARWGFWDAAHFSKLFKMQYGLAPRRYRTNVARAQFVASAAVSA